jgi:hypothetical protein
MTYRRAKSGCCSPPDLFPGLLAWSKFPSSKTNAAEGGFLTPSETTQTA